MHTYADGSANLMPNEVAAVAKALRLGRELADTMDADVHPRAGTEGTVEYQLLKVLDLLEELGVTPAELTEKLDSQHKPQ